MKKNCVTCDKEFSKGFRRSNTSWATAKYCSLGCHKVWNKGRKGLWLNDKFKYLNSIQKGENHPRWIADRTKLAKTQERNDSAYKEWRKSVRDRDGWRCKISNSDCLGKVIAHPILPWRDHQELRYDINNGITLFVFHHPHKRDEEMRLSPYFQALVGKSH